MDRPGGSFTKRRSEKMNREKTTEFVTRQWDESIIPTLSDYIRVPNKSPIFDPEWEQHGHMERAVSLLEEWCRQQPIAGMQTEIVRLPGRTPLLLINLPDPRDVLGLLHGD